MPFTNNQIGKYPVPISPVLPAEGGTGITSYSSGDILYATGPSALARLTVGSSGQVLTVQSGLPSWQNNSSSGSWVEVTGTSQSMSVNVNYIANNASLVTLTLPATASIGQFVQIDGKGAGLYRVAQNSGQVIRTGTTDTTVGTVGSLTATNRYDCILLRCITANSDWVIENVKGAFTII